MGGGPEVNIGATRNGAVVAGSIVLGAALPSAVSAHDLIVGKDGALLPEVPNAFPVAGAMFTTGLGSLALASTLLGGAPRLSHLMGVGGLGLAMGAAVGAVSGIVPLGHWELQSAQG